MLGNNAQLDFLNEKDGIVELVKLLSHDEQSVIRKSKALLAIFIDVESPDVLDLVC